MKKLFYLSIVLFLFSQCSNADKSENNSSNEGTNNAQETNNNANSAGEDDLNTDIITNNSTASDPGATNKEPKFKFEEEEWDFGTITDGEQVSHTFKFKNIGNADLVISSASASCGCTIPKHTKEPIPPGKTGEIAVTFNSSGKGQGVPVTKDVTIIANTNPVQTILRIKSVVLPPSK